LEIAEFAVDEVGPLSETADQDFGPHRQVDGPIAPFGLIPASYQDRFSGLMHRGD
jgi:hypothetical protein